MKKFLGHEHLTRSSTKTAQRNRTVTAFFLIMSYPFFIAITGFSMNILYAGDKSPA